MDHVRPTRPEPAIVYVIDDDRSVRQATALLLEVYGFRVQAFATGAEFLARARLEEPGCAIIDYLLPGGIGTQLVEALEDASSPIKSIILTGLDRNQISNEAPANRAYAIIEKPVPEGVLVETVEMAWRESVADMDRRSTVRA